MGMGQKAGQKSRGNGEGNIRQKSDGRWEARITIGYNDNGKQKLKYFSGRTRQECSDKLAEFRTQSNKGTYIEQSKYTVGKWLDVWYENHVVNSVKISTRVIYEMIIITVSGLNLNTVNNVVLIPDIQPLTYCIFALLNICTFVALRSKLCQFIRTFLSGPATKIF